MLIHVTRFATLGLTAVLLVQGLEAQAPAPGILRIRNDAQLPVAALTLDDRDVLTDGDVMPGQSIDVPIPTTGSYRVGCILGFRRSGRVDTVVVHRCLDRANIRAGEVTQLRVRRARAIDLLAKIPVGPGDRADPVFGGPGKSPAVYQAVFRVKDGSGMSRIEISPGGTARALTPSGVLEGPLTEVSWPTMSTAFTVSIAGKLTFTVDRPYYAFTIANGPPLPNRVSRVTLLTYQFCGYGPGAETSMLPDRSRTC